MASMYILQFDYKKKKKKSCKTDEHNIYIIYLPAFPKSKSTAIQCYELYQLWTNSTINPRLVYKEFFSISLKFYVIHVRHEKCVQRIVVCTVTTFNV